MLHKKWYLLFSALFCAGVMMFLIMSRVVSIHVMLPSRRSAIAQMQVQQPKKIALYAYKDGSLKRETTTMMWSHDQKDNIVSLLGKWLTYQQDEKLISRYLVIEAATLSPLSGELILSWSQSPFDRDWSTWHKWHMVESLCATIKNAGIPASFIIFLVNNKSLEDDHIDFSRPWPIDGFLKDHH